MKKLKCSTCNLMLPLEKFSKKASAKCRNGYSYKCKNCHNKYSREKWYPKNQQKQVKSSAKWKEKNKIKVLATRYKLDYKEVQNAFDLANGKCPICDRETKLVLDHCHKTGLLRGFICQKCNIALGKFGDNLEGLQKAIKYLENFEKKL